MEQASQPTKNEPRINTDWSIWTPRHVIGTAGAVRRKYKGVKVGEYIPDLMVEDAVVADAKVNDRITNHELGQMLNDLKITGLEVGLILNFKYAKLQWKRVSL